jgi:hypothetical protein
MLTPRGHIVATVPAFMFLWSEQHHRHHHYRRYTKQKLADLAIAAGLGYIRYNYFNAAVSCSCERSHLKEHAASVRPNRRRALFVAAQSRACQNFRRRALAGSERCLSRLGQRW